MQDGQDKARRLAGAGLRGGQQITPSQHQGNGLGLDRGRRGVTGVLNGTQQGRGQTKIRKIRSNGGIQGKTPATARHNTAAPIEAEETRGR